MSADYNIQGTGFQTLLYVCYLLGGPKAAHIINIARKVLQTPSERIEMLKRKNCSRHKHSYLLAVRNGLECSPDGNLGLSESDIPANEPVHRAFVLHVHLHGLNGLLLIRSILIHERRLKLLLHICVR